MAGWSPDACPTPTPVKTNAAGTATAAAARPILLVRGDMGTPFPIDCGGKRARPSQGAPGQSRALERSVRNLS
ncbi:hypothetical protein TPA0910_69020 [Streptomyces hygroscopicus subsp. sporocinereus]|uniref:Uncharacterized protein n=1 Tax=Streptomyces hygroscopicus TaxID=1912 RepID=A0ABQ3UA37_STRHY|nr:hypothetical protein TPA0910_69020 [Streptomyces hygroscopicus]